MITRMRIRNFKSFGPDSDWFPLGKLTLILGENSSGKSTILQTLLLMSQSWQAPLQFLKLSGDGHHLSAGPLNNHTHFGRPLPAEFGFEISGLQIELFYAIEGGASRAPLTKIESRFVDSDLMQRWIPKTDPTRPNEAFFTMENFRDWLHANPNEQTRALLTACEQADREAHGRRIAELTRRLDEIQTEWAATLDEAAESGDGSVDAFADLDPTEDIREAIADEKRNPTKADISLGVMLMPDSMEVKLEGNVGAEDLPAFAAAFDASYLDWFRIENGMSSLADDLPDVGMIANFLEGTWRRILQLRDELMPLAYLGPTRVPGQRLYAAQPPWRPTPYVGKDGRFLAFALAEAGPGAVAAVNRSLELQGVPYSISVREAESSSGALALKLHKKDSGARGMADSGLTVDLCDVGFGISQLLPVLGQLCILRRPLVANPGTACLVVEQPELHLHPKWQSELASELLGVWPAGRAVFGSEAGEDSPVQAIVETHSELMVLRISRLLRTSALLADVASDLPPAEPVRPYCVLSCGIVGNVSVVKAIEFDADGWFDRGQFFEGFFADRIDEEMAT